MAEPNRLFHLLLLLLLLLFSLSMSISPCSVKTGKARTRTTNKFVSRSCNATLYPRLCYDSLHNSSATDTPHLAKDATNVALSRLVLVSDHVASIIRSASKKASNVPTVDKLTTKALRDCREELSDAEDLIRESSKEMEALLNATSSKVAWHVGNAQTWMSAALTNEDGCVDAFTKPSSSVAGGGGGGKVGADVVSRVKLAKQYTSNALALINRLA